MDKEWLIKLLLNSFSYWNYEWFRKDLLAFMMNMKIMVKYEDIIKQIVTEQHNGTRALETALAVKQCTSPKNKLKYCTICKKMNHTIKSAGRKVEAIMQMHQTGSRTVVEISERRRRIKRRLMCQRMTVDLRLLPLPSILRNLEVWTVKN